MTSEVSTFGGVKRKKLHSTDKIGGHFTFRVAKTLHYRTSVWYNSLYQAMRSTVLNTKKPAEKFKPARSKGINLC